MNTLSEFASYRLKCWKEGILLTAPAAFEEVSKAISSLRTVPKAMTGAVVAAAFLSSVTFPGGNAFSQSMLERSYLSESANSSHSAILERIAEIDESMTRRIAGYVNEELTEVDPDLLKIAREVVENYS